MNVLSHQVYEVLKRTRCTRAKYSMGKAYMSDTRDQYAINLDFFSSEFKQCRELKHSISHRAVWAVWCGNRNLSGVNLNTGTNTDQRRPGVKTGAVQELDEWIRWHVIPRGKTHRPRGEIGDQQETQGWGHQMKTWETTGPWHRDGSCPSNHSCLSATSVSLSVYWESWLTDARLKKKENIRSMFMFIWGRKYYK